MTDHKAIADAELHEMKGAASASVNQVPIADGAGSTAFGTPPYKYTLQGTIEDISTAGSIYIPIPQAGTISKIVTVLGEAIATANAGISFTINATPITSSAITVAYSGSASGDVDTSTPSAANEVAVSDYIKVTTDGASTNTIALNITVLITV